MSKTNKQQAVKSLPLLCKQTRQETTPVNRQQFPFCVWWQVQDKVKYFWNVLSGHQMQPILILWLPGAADCLSGYSHEAQLTPSLSYSNKDVLIKSMLKLGFCPVGWTCALSWSLEVCFEEWWGGGRQGLPSPLSSSPSLCLSLFSCYSEWRVWNGRCLSFVKLWHAALTAKHCWPREVPTWSPKYHMQFGTKSGHSWLQPRTGFWPFPFCIQLPTSLIQTSTAQL